jgi:hypothetical protein
MKIEKLITLEQFVENMKKANIKDKLRKLELIYLYNDFLKQKATSKLLENIIDDDKMYNMTFDCIEFNNGINVYKHYCMLEGYHAESLRSLSQFGKEINLKNVEL